MVLWVLAIWLSCLLRKVISMLLVAMRMLALRQWQFRLYVVVNVCRSPLMDSGVVGEKFLWRVRVVKGVLKHVHLFGCCTGYTSRTCGDAFVAMLLGITRFCDYDFAYLAYCCSWVCW